MNDPMAFVRSGRTGTLSKSATDARPGRDAMQQCFRAEPHSSMLLCFCLTRIACKSHPGTPARCYCSARLHFELALCAIWNFATPKTSGDQMQPPSNDDHDSKPTRAQIDLAMLFMTDLHVGSERLYKIKRKGTSLNLRYEVDGELHQRSYLSALSWRAILLFALTEGKVVTVHEMDEPARYRRLVPNTLLRRLHWHARPNASFPPVARLYDPNGNAVVLLTRSRLCGHAVDALHNLSDGGPVFQPLWISDIMALRPMLGIDLVRDETFTATLPISAYLEAAAITGRIVYEPELLGMRLTGDVSRLAPPPSSKATRSIFDQRCRENSALEKLRNRTIYEDYSFPT